MAVTLASIYKTIAAIQTVVSLVDSVKKATKDPGSPAAAQLSASINPLILKAARQINAYSLKRRRKALKGRGR